MCGLFELSAWLFRRRLQILCYHGFEILDECAFRPLLFISAQAFARRLRRIEKRGLHVLPLGDAVNRLRSGTLPDNAVVITIDDGFASTASVAAPLLQQFGMTATVYVTTYYAERNVPVFRLALQYLFWRAGPFPVEGLDLGRFGLYGDTEHNRKDPESVWQQLMHYGEALESEQERQALLGRIARVLCVDIQTLYDRRLLSLMSGEEVQALAKEGFDIQLHTHRHRFPRNDEAAACAEIRENRSRLEGLTGRAAKHFCYPSGEFTSAQWPWLESLGIESATTCLPGSNDAETPRYGLKRFLDSEAVRDVEFDAELSGFYELARALKTRATLRLWKRSDYCESQTISR